MQVCGALLCILCFYEVAFGGAPCHLSCSCWFTASLFEASWGFLFDHLALLMCCVVTIISTIIHLYAISYMQQDPHLPRFMCYLSLFCFFMLILVTGDNFLTLFLGWEGVGLCSYLLINFWYTRLQANKSAIKAMLINRVGDLGLALGIMLSFMVFKSIQFSELFACADRWDPTSSHSVFFNLSLCPYNTLCILLFIGAVGKSAQLGLHAWLPDAMEGPTPVSALIHAATMVCSGVFLIARCSPFFIHASTASAVFSIIGACTCVFAAMIGIFQTDLKRVIAYSTCSQLGYMIFAGGVYNYAGSMYHLFTHGFFKALLFLSAGVIIHACSDEQDMRRLGGYRLLLPLAYATTLAGSAVLVGTPFIAHSKEMILEVGAITLTPVGGFSTACGSICVVLSAIYTFRMILLTFWQPSTGTTSLLCAPQEISESTPLTTVSLVFLASCCLFVGYLFQPLLVGAGTDFWGNSLMLPVHTIESEFLTNQVKLRPVLLLVLGLCFVLGFGFSKAGSCPPTYARWIYTFFNRRQFYDKIMNDLLSYPLFRFGFGVTTSLIDKGLIEVLVPVGCTNRL
uniref:NADH-ubiquinone oxidoreductase chain 5 n=1 Tax=Caulerpa ashmeadii TaxID=177078 RepID=A0A6B9VYK9_9CHLO|nr:NADH dehydrogenase subunit 5 [Caulerpa ashmeadii]QHQ73220.1 NADH dehydrogenase subunit 5 [Caulerpa ashmeadii]